MTTRQQWLTIAGIVSALGVVLGIALTQLGEELFPLKIGDRAPQFEAVTMTADQMPKGIDSYRGEVVLLNIWATWCGPCRIEMPSMQRLQQQLGPKGLKIVAVSIDVAGNEKLVADFAAELGLTFEILHNPIGDIQRAYQTTGVPESFVIDRSGRIRRRSIGAEDWASASNIALFERLLAEPRP